MGLFSSTFGVYCPLRSPPLQPLQPLLGSHKDAHRHLVHGKQSYGHAMNYLQHHFSPLHDKASRGATSKSAITSQSLQRGRGNFVGIIFQQTKRSSIRTGILCEITVISQKYSIG